MINSQDWNSQTEDVLMSQEASSLLKWLIQFILTLY